MQFHSIDQSISQKDIQIRLLTQQIENKCDQLYNQQEQLTDLKQIIAKKLQQLHEIETTLTQNERKQNLKNQKRLSFDSFEYSQLYEEFMLAKIKNTSQQHQLKEYQLKQKEIMLHHKHLLKKQELHSLIREELSHTNFKLQQELKKKVEFLNKFGLLVHSKHMKNVTSTHSMRNYTYLNHQDSFVSNQIKNLELLYMDSQVPFLLFKNQEIEENSKVKETDDELSLNVPFSGQNNLMQSQEFICDESEKQIQRTLKEEFDECLEVEEQIIQLTSSLFQ